jgi:PAS domain S-box-containing protein
MPRSSPSSRSTLDPQDLLTSTAVAAFSSDQSGHITVWNQAAEALLGHEATRVVGKPCCKVICGRDLFGNRFCNESCAVRKMRRHREPIHPYQFQVKHRSGEMLKVKCSVIIAPSANARRFNFIHLMEPLDRAPEIGSDQIAQRDTTTTGSRPSSGKRKSVPSNSLRKLTPREIEVLRLVASGTSTKDISHALDIQASTASNHIQHILAKLGAHTKLQAVYVAQRCGLL